jgi:hypothetical protein
VMDAILDARIDTPYEQFYLTLVSAGISKWFDRKGVLSCTIQLQMSRSRPCDYQSSWNLYHMFLNTQLSYHKSSNQIVAHKNKIEVFFS